MLSFFADQCVPTLVIQVLQDSGYEVHRLRDHIPTNSPDEIVISQAQILGAILVSLNGDFADIVAYPPSEFNGIIALQVRNHPEIIPQLMLRLTSYLAAHPDRDHYVGKLFAVEVHRIRIRE
jgi:predicted nuclease of predicted toxin-antitoxin system